MFKWLRDPRFRQMDDVGEDPQAWLADVPGRIAGHKIARLDEPMPGRYPATAA